MKLRKALASGRGLAYVPISTNPSIMKTPRFNKHSLTILAFVIMGIIIIAFAFDQARNGAERQAIITDSVEVYAEECSMAVLDDLRDRAILADLPTLATEAEVACAEFRGTLSDQWGVDEDVLLKAEGQPVVR